LQPHRRYCSLSARQSTELRPCRLLGVCTRATCVSPGAGAVHRAPACWSARHRAAFRSQNHFHVHARRFDHLAPRGGSPASIANNLRLNVFPADQPSPQRGADPLQTCAPAAIRQDPMTYQYAPLPASAPRRAGRADLPRHAMCSCCTRRRNSHQFRAQASEK